jgi:hypothetical protein
MKISREATEVIPAERADRDEDPPGPDDLPLRSFRDGERHARMGPVVPRGRGIHSSRSPARRKSTSASSPR